MIRPTLSRYSLWWVSNPDVLAGLCRYSFDPVGTFPTGWLVTGETPNLYPQREPRQPLPKNHEPDVTNVVENESEGGSGGNIPSNNHTQAACNGPWAEYILRAMPKPQRVPPKQNQLDDMLRKHISFEINRFRLATLMWGQSQYGALSDAMIRESCLIHLRLLLDFFYPRIAPEKSTFQDVFVTDYLPDKTRLSQEFQDLLVEPPWVKGYRNQLDWRLAHITTKRLDFEKNPVWRPEKQFEHLERLISGFLSALPDDMWSLFNPDQQ